MLYFVGRRDWVKGRVVEMSHAVKNKANGILFLKGNYMYLSILFHGLGVALLSSKKKCHYNLYLTDYL